MSTPPSPQLVLLSPKGPLYRKRGGIFGKGLRYMPQTFPTLVSMIPEDVPLEVTCIDEGIQEVDAHSLQADLVGMTVITGTSTRAYELADILRTRGIPVVLGGPHVTLVPEEAAQHADAVLTGLADVSWPQLLRDWRDGTLQKVYHQPPPYDLDPPFPDRSVLPKRKYITDAVFEATRGCRHSCEFCVSPSAWGRKLWKKPVEHVVEDIRRHGGKRAIFVDLNLISDRQYALDLFQALTPLKVQWYGLSTTRLTKDEELLSVFSKSGCKGLLVGFESIDHSSLKPMNKTFNRPEEYAKDIEILHQYGIAVQGCFVFGNDGETLDVFERTARFAVEAGVDLPRFAISTPFPGTPLFARLKKEGRILHENWSWYDAQHCVFQPKGMTPQELEAGTELAWKTAYKWSSSYKRMKKSPAPWYVGLITNLTYRMYANNLHKFYTCDWGLAR